jgi:hypothetical protein
MRVDEIDMVNAQNISDSVGEEYWEQFRRDFLSSNKRFKPGPVDSPRRLHINHCADSGLATVRIVKPRKGSPRTIGVWLILKGDNRTALLNSLLQDKAEIERQVGIPGRWDWDENRSGKKVEGRHTIRLEKEANAAIRGEWNEQHKWLHDVLNRFLDVFGPRVPSLRQRDED